MKKSLLLFSMILLAYSSWAQFTEEKLDAMLKDSIFYVIPYKSTDVSFFSNTDLKGGERLKKLSMSDDTMFLQTPEGKRISISIKKNEAEWTDLQSYLWSGSNV